MELTPLERDVLDWIARNSPEAAVRDQLSHVEAVDREFTGVGSYTSLRVPAGMPRVAFRVSPVDPFVESPELEHGAGVVLFFENGLASTLELYAIGDSFPEAITDWRLLPWDLPAERGGEPADEVD